MGRSNGKRGVGRRGGWMWGGHRGGEMRAPNEHERTHREDLEGGLVDAAHHEAAGPRQGLEQHADVLGGLGVQPRGGLLWWLCCVCGHTRSQLGLQFVR